MRPLRRLALLLTACAPLPPEAPPTAATSPPVPRVDLGGDWVIVEETAESLALRWRDSADGVRIDLATTDRALAGVTPIVAGRTLAIEQDGRRIPMFGVPLPDAPLTAATVEVQGPDLLVRLEGPPLDTLTDHPDAPESPVLSWVRLRRRPGSWRLVLQGLHVWTLPAEGLSSTHLGDHRELHTAFGTFEVTSQAPAWSGGLDRDRWWLDTTPSADRAAPYPRTGMTFTP